MTGRAPPAPHDWMQGWAWPWPAARSLPDGTIFRGCFCVVALQLARTRNDQPYLRLTLSDRYGSLEARLWEGAEAAMGALRPGLYVGAQGRIEHFNGELQLCLERLEPVHVSLADLPLFLPHSSRAREDMELQLEQVVASVQDAPLRELLRTCLDAESEVGQGFRLAPAAKYNHHAYLGGLLEHTLSVAMICDGLAEHYGPGIDRELLLTAALLHDIGKVREIGVSAGFPYTDEGKLLGHILLGLELVTSGAHAVPSLSAQRLLLLQHLIAAHQGRYEWQSPREPATLEAIILHYADDLDAKLQQVSELLRQSEGPWTPYDRSFRREFLRHLGPAEAATPGNEPEPERSVAEQAPLPPPAAVAPVPESAPACPPASATRCSEDRGHAPRRHRFRGPNGFELLSEDTLDLFGGPEN